MTDNGDRRPIFLLHLRPEPHVADAVASLRAALKVLLRRFGMRAISCEEVRQKDEQS